MTLVEQRRDSTTSPKYDIDPLEPAPDNPPSSDPAGPHVARSLEYAHVFEDARDPPLQDPGQF